MNKARQSPSVQSTKPQRSELLRSIMAPRVIAEFYQKRDISPEIQNLAQKAIRIIVGSKVASLIAQNRSRIRQNVTRRQMYPGSRALFQRHQIVVQKTLCKRRTERREQLFSMGIAGAGRRSSPGQGGSYKRDQNSRISC